jgi:cold-inducible RNA-binding protein
MIEMNTKMYVGNLPFSTTETELRDLFAAYGAVVEIHLPADRDTGRLRGFAFVTMDSSDSMNNAVTGVNAKQWNGRVLAVNEARPREERPAGAGGFGNRADKRARW